MRTSRGGVSGTGIALEFHFHVFFLVPVRLEELLRGMPVLPADDAGGETRACPGCGSAEPDDRWHESDPSRDRFYGLILRSENCTSRASLQSVPRLLTRSYGLQPCSPEA